MSREFKFRYWDIINEAMHEDAHLLDSFNEKLARPKEYCVMQFTGLSDKNGKPVYEGDLIKTQHRVYTVKWIEHEAMFAAENAHAYIDVGNWNRYEIIGNIHQNKDLLVE